MDIFRIPPSNAPLLRLSVVVPAYKQAATIAKDMQRLSKTLSKLPYAYEILLVVDGLVDNTAAIARALNIPSLKVISYEQNVGKGYAIRQGMAQAEGEQICFIDAGMDLDPVGILLLLDYQQWYSADIVIGSKRHPDSKVHYPFLRKCYSYGYQLLVKLLFGLNIRDSQVGLKLFKRNVILHVFPFLTIDRFAFDIELLWIAHKLGYTRIVEAPVHLEHQFLSSIRMISVFEMLRDTLKIAFRFYLTNKYDKLALSQCNRYNSK